MQFTKGLGQDSEKILLTLRRELEQEVYPALSRFPTAAELCQRFESSRNTILRALERLVAEGFIETRRGAPTIVLKAGKPSPMSRTLSTMITFDAENLISTQDEALERGFLMCTFSRHKETWDPGPERIFLERVRAARHMGLLACLTPALPTNADLIRNMAAEGIRILHLEPYELTPPEQNYLMPDFVRGGSLAVTTALLRGFRRIVFAGTASDWPTARLFRQGVEEEVEAHDQVEHFEYFEFPTGTDQNPEANGHLMEYLASCPPGTAIIARSVNFCHEIHNAFVGRGLRPNTDFLTLAPNYLNEPVAVSPFPTVHYNKAELLKQAVGLLTGDHWPRIQKLVKPQILSPLVSSGGVS